jgi:hypothetical protein
LKWLGVAILLGFSLALNLFMRLELKPRAQLPPELRDWRRLPADDTEADHYVETRVVEVERWFGRKRWLEQQRVRRVADGEILEILPERRYRHPSALS